MIDTTKPNNFILYSTADNKTNIQIIADSKNETIWLTQSQIADIFDTTKQNISTHITNIYKENELSKALTIKKILTAQKEGSREIQRNIEYYNLDIVISVGYRVNTAKATQFRTWATQTLKEFIIKGFVLDDERLKQGNQVFNKDYFNDLLERIRAIRASEKLFYEKVRQAFALSVDYNPNSQDAHYFFAHIQNKLEYAVVGMTSAQIIKQRANHKLPNMGLLTFSGKKISSKDTQKAKNYLKEEEIKDLNRLVAMLLDYLENQTKLNKIFYMKDWNAKLDKFLQFNEYEILQGYGQVKAQMAKEFALQEFKQYKQTQDKLETQEFDQIVQTIKSTGKIPSKKEKLSSFNQALKKTLF